MSSDSSCNLAADAKLPEEEQLASPSEEGGSRLSRAMSECLPLEGCGDVSAAKEDSNGEDVDKEKKVLASPNKGAGESDAPRGPDGPASNVSALLDPSLTAQEQAAAEYEQHRLDDVAEGSAIVCQSEALEAGDATAKDKLADVVVSAEATTDAVSPAVQSALVAFMIATNAASHGGPDSQAVGGSHASDSQASCLLAKESGSTETVDPAPKSSLPPTGDANPREVLPTWQNLQIGKTMLLKNCEHSSDHALRPALAGEQHASPDQPSTTAVVVDQGDGNTVSEGVLPDSVPGGFANSAKPSEDSSATTQPSSKQTSKASGKKRAPPESEGAKPDMIDVDDDDEADFTEDRDAAGNDGKGKTACQTRHASNW